VAHHVSADADRLICTEILHPGYRLGDRLLRPAHVEVTGPPPPERNPGAGPERGGHEDDAEAVSELRNRTRAGPGDQGGG
jgi:molecular chaperone GrpE